MLFLGMRAGEASGRIWEWRIEGGMSRQWGYPNGTTRKANDPTQNVITAAQITEGPLLKASRKTKHEFALSGYVPTPIFANERRRARVHTKGSRNKGNGRKHSNETADTTCGSTRTALHCRQSLPVKGHQ